MKGMGAEASLRDLVFPLLRLEPGLDVTMQTPFIGVCITLACCSILTTTQNEPVYLD